MIIKRSLGAWRAPEVQNGDLGMDAPSCCAVESNFTPIGESPMIVYQRITAKYAPHHTVPEYFHGFGAYPPMPSNP